MLKFIRRWQLNAKLTEIHTEHTMAVRLMMNASGDKLTQLQYRIRANKLFEEYCRLRDELEALDAR